MNTNKSTFLAKYFHKLTLKIEIYNLKNVFFVRKYNNARIIIQNAYTQNIENPHYKHIGIRNILYNIKNYF